MGNCLAFVEATDVDCSLLEGSWHGGSLEVGTGDVGFGEMMNQSGTMILILLDVALTLLSDVSSGVEG